MTKSSEIKSANLNSLVGRSVALEVQPLVYVIVLHYNTGPLLLECLESLEILQYSNYKVLLIDNASTDGMPEIAKQRSLVTDFVHNRVNSGYCGGNNSGIAVALNDEAKYILVLNPDTVVSNPCFLSELVGWMESHQRAGFVGPSVSFRDAQTIQNTSCHFPFLTRRTSSFLKSFLLRSKADSEEFERPRQVNVLNGVCVLLRASMLREIGLYDEKMFMYGEDWDLSYRAQLKNWNSWQLPIASVVHKQKEEGYDYLSMTNFLLKRNAVLFLKKHNFVFQAVCVAIGALIVSFLRIALLGVRQHKGVVLYWRFFLRLLMGCLMAILGRHNRSGFGPPNVAWWPIKP